jgi:hypothetical protein
MFLGLFTFYVEKTDELKMELNDRPIQCHSVLKQKFCEVGVPKFYSLLPRD